MSELNSKKMDCDWEDVEIELEQLEADNTVLRNALTAAAGYIAQHCHSLGADTCATLELIKAALKR